MNLKAGDRVAAVALLNGSNGHEEDDQAAEDAPVDGATPTRASRAGQNLGRGSKRTQAADSPSSQV